MAQATLDKSHPLASSGIRAYVWVMLAAVLAVQSAGVWALCVSEQQLCDFGRFYYAVLAWREGGGLYQPNLATSKVINGRPFEMMNVASPLWHLAAWPFTKLPPGSAFFLWTLCNIAAW